MTHDELLAKIDFSTHQLIPYPESVKHNKALRAVVELHKPVVGMVFTSDLRCNICYEISEDGYDFYDVSYPCPTVQAIEKELA